MPYTILHGSAAGRITGLYPLQMAQVSCVRYPAFLARCSRISMRVSWWLISGSRRKHSAHVGCGRVRKSLASSGCVQSDIRERYFTKESINLQEVEFPAGHSERRSQQDGSVVGGLCLGSRHTSNIPPITYVAHPVSNRTRQISEFRTPITSVWRPSQLSGEVSHS